jgi:opacity protein-like surface antigen
MTMKYQLTYALLLLFLLPAAVRAQDKWRIEAYGGIYHLHDFENEVTYGARVGIKTSDHFGLEGSVGTFSTSFSFGPVKIKDDATLVDLSLKAYLNPGGKAQLFLFGGPGWAFSNVNALGTSLAHSDSFSAHIGAGLDVKLTDHLYVRPDIRGRWLQKNNTNSLDVETTVAFGFSF